MNMLYNTQRRDQTRSEYGDNKMSMPMQPDSLFSMALYDFEGMNNQQVIEPPAPSNSNFHPVQEYKDLSLREILELSDDFLFKEDDLNLNPIPLKAPVSAPVHKPMSHPLERDLEPFPVQSFDRVKMPEQNFNCDLMQQQGQQQRIYHQQQQQRLFQQEQQNLIQQEQQSFLQLQQNLLQQQNFMQDDIIRQQQQTKKRSRDGEEDELDADGERRFRPYQAGQWSEKFDELCEYRKSHGHCLVPHTYEENLPLARWVKRQRYQYKLMMEGKPSTMTPDRVTALEDIGFVWDSQGAAWGERLTELAEFRRTYMHCNVPSNFSENPQLATWVKCQRRQYKLYAEGKPSNMTPQRIFELEKLGFEWELRTYKKSKTC